MSRTIKKIVTKRDPSRTLFFWVLISVLLIVLLGFGVVGYWGDRISAQTVWEQEGPFLVREPGTVVDAIEREKNLTILNSLVSAAAYQDVLNDDGPYTVFAPVNSAFDRLPDGVLANLKKPANKNKLTKILSLHVSPGAYLQADVADLEQIPTLNGQDLQIDVRGEEVLVNSAEIEGEEVVTGNGVIIFINGVLFPDDVLMADLEKKNDE